MSKQYKTRSEVLEQEKNKKKKKKDHSKKKSVFKKIFMTLLYVSLVAFVTGVVFLMIYASRAPELDRDQLGVPPSSKVYDKDGNLFADIGEQQRITVSYEELPDVLIDAVIATEDARFFEHNGIDLLRIGGAIVANFTDGFGSEGGSTITQQVIKGAFLYPEKTIERKVQEQWLALQLDRIYSKEDILELYLNRIYYGSGGYGVATAAENYFSITDLSELSLPQAALLAGLPQRPSAYDPTVNKDLAKERMDIVLDLMVRHEKISTAEAEEAKAVEIDEILNVSKRNRVSHADFLDQVQRELMAEYDVDLYNDGVIVRTTLDQNAQSYVEYLLSDESPVRYSDDQLQSGVSVVETTTGAIVALGGGRNRSDGGFNMAIQAKRQLGSAAKPLFSYGPAIEYLDYSTYEQMPDTGPYAVTGSKPINNIGRYRGQVTLRTALQHSSNVVAVHLFDEVGTSDVLSFIENLNLPVPDDGINIRDAIGGSQFQASTLEMASAYAAFGNEGIYNEPFSVISIEYPDGTVVESKASSQIAMSDATAYMVTDMMKTVVTNGTGARAQVPGVPVAGKTGTTNDNVDKWFVGLSTQYSIGVWTGYSESSTEPVKSPDQNNSMYLFKEMMTELSKGKEVADFNRPESVASVKVERGSNPARLPSAFTPSNQVITELFKVGTEPRAVSEAFESLSPVTNLKATYDETSNRITIDWAHSNPNNVPVSFEVVYQTEGSSAQPINTSDQQVIIDAAIQGTSYTIKVTAVHAERTSLTSETKTIVLNIPAIPEEPEEPVEPEAPEEPEEPVEPEGPDEPEEPVEPEGPEEPEAPVEPEDNEPPQDDAA